MPTIQHAPHAVHPESATVELTKIRQELNELNTARLSELQAQLTPEILRGLASLQSLLTAIDAKHEARKNEIRDTVLRILELDDHGESDGICQFDKEGVRTKVGVDVVLDAGSNWFVILKTDRLYHDGLETLKKYLKRGSGEQALKGVLCTIANGPYQPNLCREVDWGPGE